MPKRLGQSASSLFRRTEPEPVPAPREPKPSTSSKAHVPRHTIRTKAEEAREKVTFLLTPRQSMYLDELCFKVKRATGYDLARTEVIRAAITLLMELEVDEAVKEQIRELRRRGRTEIGSAVEQILVESIEKCVQERKKG
uniref:Uncharacterized protein n=1 Tax=uncultured prokaryote TaxID=198431 RepID=H5S968_9ZZZZ|nr:hypothetical protein HGMM_F03A04C27 [uncultured prokaryote]